MPVEIYLANFYTTGNFYSTSAHLAVQTHLLGQSVSVALNRRHGGHLFPTQYHHYVGHHQTAPADFVLSILHLDLFHPQLDPHLPPRSRDR